MELQLRLVNKKNGSNYKFVSEEKKKEKAEKIMANGYSYFIARLLDRAFNFAPQKAEISNASLLFVNDTLKREVRLNKFHSDVNSVKGEFEDVVSNSLWECRSSGRSLIG